jgi:hypothetical protein
MQSAFWFWECSGCYRGKARALGESLAVLGQGLCGSSFRGGDPGMIWGGNNALDWLANLERSRCRLWLRSGLLAATLIWVGLRISAIWLSGQGKFPEVQRVRRAGSLAVYQAEYVMQAAAANLEDRQVRFPRFWERQEYSTPGSSRVQVLVHGRRLVSPNRSSRRLLST